MYGILERIIYSPTSPLRKLYWRLPRRVRFKLSGLVWGGIYLWRRRYWRWAGDYLSGIEYNFGIGEPNLVSVVLPVFNQANTLGKSIDSVLQQSYPHFELIIVNDGSTDGTQQILEKYTSHPRITIIKQDNQRLPRALNRGFQEAKGEFFSWTSADNLMHKEQLRQLITYMRINGNVALVYHDFELIDDEDQLIADAGAFFPRGEKCSPNVRLKHEPKRLNIGFENVVGPCFMYRSFLRLLIGDYDSRLEGVEDYDYWIRINNFFTVRHLGDFQPLYRYRVSLNSMTTRLKPRISQLRHEVMKREQLLQQRLRLPLSLVMDEKSMKLFENIKPHRDALPKLKCELFNQGSSITNSSFKPAIIHISSLNNDITKYRKTSKSPLLCWAMSKDSSCSFPKESLSQVDLIISFGNTSFDTAKNAVHVQKYEDLYHLARIFAASRMAL